MARPLASPNVRIGMIQRQPVIRCRLQGSFRLEDAQGHTLATLNENASQLEFRPSDAKPAVVQWRSVLLKSPTRESAERFIAGLPMPGEGQAWDIEIVGGTWQTPDGLVLDNREWWVHSPAMENQEECRHWCIERRLPHQIIVPKIRRPPQGLISCQSAAITASGLLTGALFRLIPVETRGSRVGLSNVVVGLNFHWQHYETQWLRGSVEVLLDIAGALTAVNMLTIEEYLLSVVGSEMKAEMPHELLKVQAVCARNTVLATAGKHHRGEPFDLCADDHCQCYRGSSRESRESREAVVSTWGEVLVSGNRLCDTRYSKICGGISEAAHSVWGGPPINYMQPIIDVPANVADVPAPPASTETAARAFIASAPLAFCNCRDRDVPAYLHYAAKYFRWEAKFNREDLERLLFRIPEVRQVGEVRELVARRRGASGRIEELAIIGTAGEFTIGRELGIRQALSTSTLYSACFVVDHEHAPDGQLLGVTLRGAGWGHGAGMCQIGATVMALENYSHEQILTHYYRDTDLRFVYERLTNWASLLEHLDDGDFTLNNRCWEAVNCYELVGCPIYERMIGPDKGYLEGANRTKLYLECPEYHRQTQPT